MIQLMYAEYLKHKLFIVLLRIQQTPLVTKAINRIQNETNKKHLNRKICVRGKIGITKKPKQQFVIFSNKNHFISWKEKQSMFIFFCFSCRNLVRKT